MLANLFCRNWVLGKFNLGLRCWQICHLQRENAGVRFLSLTSLSYFQHRFGVLLQLRPVLPTPAKCRLPEKFGRCRKNRAAHTFCIEADLIDVNKDSEGMIIGKKSGNSADFTVFFQCI
jgi:hypothetical protein